MSKNNSASKLLYTQSLLRLGEMLKLLRKGDSPQNRNWVRSHCDFLLEEGKKNNFSAWVKLLQTAREAIANLDNEYEHTTKTIITEIKYAGEKLQKDLEQEIIASDKLLELIPKVEEELIEHEHIEDDEIEQIHEKEEDQRQQDKPIINFGDQNPNEWQERLLELSNFVDICVDDDIWEDTFAI